ncbi:hypothetical protein ACJJTC_018349 [Scirpophaga incertulas]
MSGKKCKHCGSSEIEVDPARGDAVCTNCGTVLEDNIIVAEVEFQENAHGGASAIGQFVSAESKGGASGFGRAFNVGIGQESREITLRKAREGIIILCQQLRLNQQCIDIACNFFKMALSRHLTIGRPANHTQAACVYITCRTEGTSHLLIDISDALQICCYQLGRAYFKLSRALCINIPPTDPCIYILRFASQLQFGEKEHEVSMTALRLVQRMKRDCIHSGRRPSGICGAALLIAGRLHNFSRTPSDVVRIVKVHESTIRKRLIEFGDTPSSALTLDEFMTVDLEEEQDPPAFRMARKRDKERLQKLIEEEDGEKELSQLQKEIDTQLEKDIWRRKRPGTPGALITPNKKNNDAEEEADASKFTAEETLHILGEIAGDVESEGNTTLDKQKFEKGLGPELAVIGLGRPDEKDPFLKPERKTQFSQDLAADELVMSEQDEEYIDSLIMSEEEAQHKTMLWNKLNAGFLKDQKIKEELRAKETEDRKKRKLRGSYKKKVVISASTAGEAIEKMLAEKKISSKINYDILKSLDQPGTPSPATPSRQKAMSQQSSVPSVSPASRKRKKVEEAPRTPQTPDPAEDYEDDADLEAPDASELSLAAMLQNGQEEEYYDYEDY